MVELIEIDTIKVKEVEGKKFFCIEVDDCRSTFRVWINPIYYYENLEGKVKKYFLGVFRNATLQKTQKGTIIIKKGRNNIFFIKVKCGYRGTSSFDVLSPHLSVHKFYYKHSPNGSLGISEMGLIETAEEYLKIQWKRTGRLYGDPSRGVSIIKLDGSIVKLDDISDEEIEEILSE
ncbi:MAG: hypothetical protein QW350_05190 [Candidatus Aenigmatarchaeota archaeon]